ncbi:MAG: hypothetical protein WCJ97_12190 [Phycisphaerae bacterium]
MTDLSTLGSVVNRVNTAGLLGEKIPAIELAQIASFLVSRQGLPGSYFGMFAPMAEELTKPYQLFTGEVVATTAATRHILGEEALRILRNLKHKTKAVTTAIAQSQAAMLARLVHAQQKGCPIGTFCCGRCTVAYWRTLNTGWVPDADARLRGGMKDLQASRANGQWRRYPFYYTVMCLTELPGDITRNEIAYIAPTCEKKLRTLRPHGLYHENKAAILERLLKCA